MTDRRPRRLSIPSLHVLAELVDSPEPLYGYQLMAACDLKSGTLYRILSRFVERGWVHVETEDIDPHVEGRPPRRYYQVTDEGRRLVVDARATLSA